jgi:hypothetical protein
MKNVTIIGILAASTPQSATPKPSPSNTQSPVDIVRNGDLSVNKTTTVGQALEHTFANGQWKSFSTPKGVTIVEFDGAEPFSASFSIQGQSIYQQACQANATCVALVTKISDYCNSEAGQSEFLENKISEVSDKSSALAGKIHDEKLLEHDEKFAELGKEESQLMRQRTNLEEVKEPCMADAIEQHANDPIPVIVQFSINHDGTFQYETNNMGWPAKILFDKMYN